MKKISCLLALLLLIPTLFSCGGERRERHSVSFFDVFDTSVTLVAITESQEVFDDAAKEVHETLLRLHRLFDIYHEAQGVNNLYQVNLSAGIAPVKVEQDLFDLLSVGLEYAEKTGGRLNICMGAVLSLWHEAREDGTTLPEKGALQEAAKHIDYQNLILDRENQTVFFADAEMKIDVGAIAKGYAGDIAAQTLEEKGIVSYAVDLGGNVVVRGYKENGELWRVGIQDPTGEGLIKTVSVGGEDRTSVVTSGDYQRYYEVAGERYHHIISYETLYPVNTFHSVTVIASSSMIADALSTSLFCLSAKEGERLVKESGAEAFWIFADQTQKESEGFFHAGNQ